MLIPLFAIPASADSDVTTGSSTSGTDVNLWTYQDWKTIFGDDFDASQYTDEVIENLKIMANNNDQICHIRKDTSSADFYAVDGDVDDIKYRQTPTSTHSIGLFSDTTKFNYHYFYTVNKSYSLKTASSTTGGTLYYVAIAFESDFNKDNNKIIIINDFEQYQDIMNDYDFLYPENIYYCENPVQSFIDFIESSAYDDMFYDVYPLKDGYQNIIRFYDCWDSYYGKYTYDFYTDNMLNYLNSSYCIDSPIYFQGKGIDTGHQLDGAELQHNEIIHIYIPVPDDFSVTNANDYLTNIGTAVHYEKGPMDFSTWYNDYIVPWCQQFSINSDYKLITLKNVEPSTSDNRKRQFKHT